MLIVVSIFAGLLLLLEKCHAVPYSEYILAPATRKLSPPSIYNVTGNVINAASLINSGSNLGNATFDGISAVTFDFQKNIAGIVSIKVGGVSRSDAFLGVTFSESSIWINSAACDATADAGLDAPLWFAVGNNQSLYSAEPNQVRGGFRCLTLSSNTSATVRVQSITVEFTAAPLQDLQAYSGYFHSNDELLNRIWYAGAYTNQLCTIDPLYGDSIPWFTIINPSDTILLPNTTQWWSNYTITSGSSALVDGAKRDRLVWPGDMVVTIPTVFVSTNDLYSLKNSLESLFVLQTTDGMLPYAGAPFTIKVYFVSFTYHLHNLISMSYYYHYSGDMDWISRYWDQFKLGMEWSLNAIDSTGMMNVTSGADWFRGNMIGHNIEANAILYHTINEGIKLANILGDNSVISRWTEIALNLKSAANTLLWDESAGLYRDNEESLDLFPQDGNSWAVKANLTTSTLQITTISASLRARWGKYGAPAPEAGVISPFASGFELESHYLAQDPSSAHDLMRLEWGHMLDDPRMTNSTFIEGFALDGGLDYNPYANKARVSHAHSWSTAPTHLLSFFTAGLRLTSASGATWLIAPQAGELASVEAGFVTAIGEFRTSWETTRVNRFISTLQFKTPEGTIGSVELPGVEGVLVKSTGEEINLVDGVASGVPGGSWQLIT